MLAIVLIKGSERVAIKSLRRVCVALDVQLNPTYLTLRGVIAQATRGLAMPAASAELAVP
jgi:hypothetical protein